jgi:hypothetical protein
MITGGGGGNGDDIIIIGLRNTSYTAVCTVYHCFINLPLNR